MVSLEEGSSNTPIEVWVEATEGKKGHKSVNSNAAKRVCKASDFGHV